MTQQTSPFIEGKFGWALGESNWNLGMDENLLKFSYLFDRNIDGIVSSLPAPVNGEAYFNTTDNRIYYVVNGVFSSTPVPKWFILMDRSTGHTYQFDGTALDQIQLSVKDFGPAGTGNGVSDDSAAALAMAAALGYIYFSRGNYVINTCTFDVPVSFERKANITVNAGQVLTITEIIESPKQYIFKGAGDYRLRNDLDSGENSHQVHISWFGAFPTVRTEISQTPFINKCFASLDNTREASVQFDSGRYNVDAPTMFVPRATAVRGDGTRRTVFGVMGDGYDVFDTLANGVSFEGIQFEPSNNLPSVYRTSGAYIRISSPLCKLKDVWGGRATQSFVIAAGPCELYEISGTYTETVGANSSLVSVQASDTSVEGVFASSTDVGPVAIVELTGAGNTANVDIKTVRWNCQSIGVLYKKASGSHAGGCTQDVHYRGLAGFEADAVVKSITTGTGSVRDMNVFDISANDRSVNLFVVEQGSSGSTSGLSLNDAKSAGGAGAGISLTRTAGTLTRFTAGSTVDVSQYATDVLRSGTMTKVKIAPEVFKNGNAVACLGYSILDDSFVTIPLGRSVFSGGMKVYSNFANIGHYGIRAANSPNSAVLTQTANMAIVNTTLNGTTGTDGKFTVGIQDGVIYLENRLGSTQTVTVTLELGEP